MNAHTWTHFTIPECHETWPMLLPSSTIWWMPSNRTPGQRYICPPRWDLDLISWPIPFSPRSRQSLIKKAMYPFLDHGTMEVEMEQDHWYETWPFILQWLVPLHCYFSSVLKLKEQLVPDLAPEGPVKQVTVGIFDFDQILQNKKIKHIGNAGNVVFITWFNCRILLQGQVS